MENMQEQDIIYELISKGMFKKGKIEKINDIRSKLRQINFDVVEWYDKSCYILINTGAKKDLILGYNEIDNKEIGSVFESVIYGREVQGNIVNSLLENEWLEYDKNEKLVLSKKTLVIFRDRILEAKGVYKQCNICSFLVYKNDMHEYCKEILSEKTHL